MENEELQVPAPETAEVVAEQQETPASDAPASETEAVSDEQKVRDAAKVMAEQRQRNRENAERRVQREQDDLRRMLGDAIAALKQGKQPEVQKPQDDAEPKREQYADYEEYIVARAEWRAEKRAVDKLNAQIAEAVQNHQRSLQQHQRQEVDRAHFSRMAQYARDNPEIMELGDRDDIRIPPAATRAIQRMEDGPALLHLIARDPSIADNMQRMDDHEQAIYVGRLSSWMQSQTRQISNAAPAGRTVANKPATSDTPPDDPDAYMAWADKKYGKR